MLDRLVERFPIFDGGSSILERLNQLIADAGLFGPPFPECAVFVSDDLQCRSGALTCAF